jgi:undecaprenyl diphosphate synthase
LDTRGTRGPIEPVQERDALRRGVLPQHIGVIMDGNGRWAQARGMSRERGHRRGADNLRSIIEECVHLGIANLSAFAFSTENWMRPPEEVRALMTLMAEFAVSEAEELAERDVRVIPIGDLSSLPEGTRREVEALADRTREGQTLTLMMAVNYGGRADILRAVRQLASGAARGELDPADIDDEHLRARLYTHPHPDPDLIIRTGGQWRLSNFFLYQAAYAEFYATDVLWPDFDGRELRRALRCFQQRERRFGRLGAASDEDSDRGGTANE